MVSRWFVGDPQLFQVSGVSVVHVLAVGWRIVVDQRSRATPLEVCVEQTLDERFRCLNDQHIFARSGDML